MSDRFFCRKCGSEARFNERLSVSFCPVHGVGFEIVRAADPTLTGQRTLDRAAAPRPSRVPTYPAAAEVAA